MEGIVGKRPLYTGESSIHAARCSQCGGVINGGRELAIDDKQVLCEGCYLLMVNPETGGDIPSKWF